MSLRSRFALLVGLSLAIGLAAPAMAAGPTARWAADAAAGNGRLIVVWKSAAPSTLHLAGVASTTTTARPMRSVVTAQPGKAAAVAASLRADPRVLTVVPDARLSLLDWPADGSPSDPLYAQQGDLAQIDVPQAWHTTTGDPSVVVAVIDSGVDLSQPDLDGVHVVDPRNVVWNNADVTDDDGHGTHVTGTIVAETNNGLGMAGIAPGSTLMPIKVADSDGFIALSDVLDAVDWAREHGADVINLSLGGTLTPEQVELGQPTFTAARDAGILTVAASGNDGNAVRMYPASFNGVVSVSAVDSTDTIADFSSTGRAVDLAAPGVDLLSVAAGGGYVRESGTSMAAPHVTGVAALVRAARPGLDVDQLEAVLRASAVDLGTPGHDPLYGDGRVDAAAALVEPVPDPIPDLDPPAPLPPITVAFIAPATKVSQTGSTYTVKLSITGEVADSIALVASWNQVNGKCQTSKQPIIHQVTFGPTIQLTNLKAGRCYQVYVAVIDEESNYAEALSPLIRILDLKAPVVAHRSPAPGALHVGRSAHVRVQFSEPVVVRAGDVTLRVASTGQAVKARYAWDKASNTLVLDPAKSLSAHTKYRVEVGHGVVDRGGNHLSAVHWSFTTGS